MYLYTTWSTTSGRCVSTVHGPSSGRPRSTRSSPSELLATGAWEGRGPRSRGLPCPALPRPAHRVRVPLGPARGGRRPGRSRRLHGGAIQPPGPAARHRPPHRRHRRPGPLRARPHPLKRAPASPPRRLAVTRCRPWGGAGPDRKGRVHFWLGPVWRSPQVGPGVPSFQVPPEASGALVRLRVAHRAIGLGAAGSCPAAVAES